MLKELTLILIVAFFAGCLTEPDYSRIEKSEYFLERMRPTNDLTIINRTFLGNFQHNYYGNEAPSRLDIIWQTYLGEGLTKVGKEYKEWKGAGWTGQPLMVNYNDTLYIIQGAYDHRLKKILAQNGKIIDEFEFDDVIKGTGTLWYNPYAKNISEKLIIMQGSRRGTEISPYAYVVKSFRAISFFGFKELWAYNSKKLRSYSRDVDASAIVVNDTGYIGLENGLFIAFDPRPANAIDTEGIKQPKIYDIEKLFLPGDEKTHGGNLVTEASPTYLNGYVYLSSGAGHIFGYNIRKKKIDWIFTTGADMDGSPSVTSDSCLLITIEKEYIPGHGGVMKLDPSKSPDSAVVWFFPTRDTDYFYWAGGVIGSATVNDMYFTTNDPRQGLVAFTAIDGYFYVVKHNAITGKKVKGPNLKYFYDTPQLVFKYRTGPAIATPVFVEDKIIVPTYEGIYLFSYDNNLNFKLLDKKVIDEFEATPFVWNKKIYVACRNGYLYCFGEK